MNSNKIPRNFIQIPGKMLINTNVDNVGDVLQIYKNDFGYLAYNNRTHKHAYYFASMLRNKDIFEIINIII